MILQVPFGRPAGGATRRAPQALSLKPRKGPMNPEPIIEPARREARKDHALFASFRVVNGASRLPLAYQSKPAAEAAGGKLTLPAFAPMSAVKSIMREGKPRGRRPGHALRPIS